MSKPDDVSQEAWDEAERVFNEVYESEPDLEGGCELGIVEAYARAIMSVKAKEREACAVLAEKAHASPPWERMDRAQVYRYAIDHADHIAAAIRSRT